MSALFKVLLLALVTTTASAYDWRGEMQQEEQRYQADNAQFRQEIRQREIEYQLERANRNMERQSYGYQPAYSQPNPPYPVAGQYYPNPGYHR